jgi:membrane-bound lytic murein transglycosylase D
MKRRLPILAAVGLFALLMPAIVLCQQPQSVIVGAPPSLVEKAASNLSAYLPEETDVPAKMREALHASELRYLEGSELIKLGASSKARVAFDEAIDSLLKSEWDLTAIPALSRYFQDLILRIQRDESRYLRADESQEKPERAVVDELSSLDLIPIQVDPALTDALEADILNSKYDIPVIFNESVRKSLSFWLGAGRKYFVDGLIRSGRYQEMIERIFREESVPRDVMYLAQVESLFKTNALSRALAKGIWQFTKGTAVRYGLKVNKYVDERSDPEKSTRAAARYLNDLYVMFKDWNLVLAAYNWGEGAIQQLVEKSGINDFWRLAQNRKMPAETKNHVPLILSSIILARNAEKFGLPTELEAPLVYDQVSVPKQINIKSAAKALNISIDLINKLNPALKTTYTPPDDPDFVLCVPAGMGVDFTEKFALLPAADLRVDPDYKGRHKVQPGETLSSIAAKYRVSVDELQAANNLSSPKLLRAGAWLTVPTADSGETRATKPVSTAGFNGSYQVKEGDTLGAIAQRYAVSVAALQSANHLASAEDLRAGSWIKVPSSQTQGATQSPVVPVAARQANRQHKVRAGDTLSTIAALYGVSVADIQKLNSIRSPNSLRIGTWLQIPPAPAKRAAVSKKG